MPWAAGDTAAVGAHWLTAMRRDAKARRAVKGIGGRRDSCGRLKRGRGCKKEDAIRAAIGRGWAKWRPNCIGQIFNFAFLRRRGAPWSAGEAGSVVSCVVAPSVPEPAACLCVYTVRLSLLSFALSTQVTRSLIRPLTTSTPTLNTTNLITNSTTANMRFFEIVVSGAALVSSALAVTIDTYPTSGVEAGKSYTITYSPKDAPATFVLRKGASGNLDTVGTIGTFTSQATSRESYTNIT